MVEKRNNAVWILSATIVGVVVLFGVRWSSDILEADARFDETYIRKPIDQLITNGWSVENAIDYEETKGPAMIWLYAIAGKALGGSLDDLRLVSVWCSIVGLAILSWIAVRSAVYRRSLYLVALGWLLLPYNIVFSELVMGEISFLMLSLCAVAAFVWGIEENSQNSRKILAPILYGIALALALHSRIHVVALAGGICITAFAMQGSRSWPWWIASIAAGLVRIPLWTRWGGLVSPEYQALHGLGIRLESMSYLAAALVPFVGIFVIEGWRLAKSKSLIISSFLLGMLLVNIAMPDLFVPKTIDYVNPNDRFQGIAASFVLKISANALVQEALLSILAGFGLAGLAGLWHCREKAPIVARVTFWSLTFGWLLYAFTRGFVFDRFILTWAFLLPIIWVKSLPRGLLALQYIGLAFIAAWLTASWL